MAVEKEDCHSSQTVALIHFADLNDPWIEKNHCGVADSPIQKG